MCGRSCAVSVGVGVCTRLRSSMMGAACCRWLAAQLGPTCRAAWPQLQGERGGCWAAHAEAPASGLASAAPLPLPPLLLGSPGLIRTSRSPVSHWSARVSRQEVVRCGSARGERHGSQARRLAGAGTGHDPLLTAPAADGSAQPFCCKNTPFEMGQQGSLPPLMTATWDTVPDAGAATVVSIFMADMTTRVC